MGLPDSTRHGLRRATATIDCITHLSGRSILILCSDLGRITHGQDLLDLGKHLSAQGATPLVAGPVGDLVEDLGDYACVPLNIPLDKGGFFTGRRTRAALGRLIARSGVDLIHAVGGRAAALGADLACSYGVPFASTLTQPLADMPLNQAEAVVAAQRIFLSNPELAPDLLQAAPHCEDRAQLAPPGVDLDAYSPSAVRSIELVEFIERLNIPHHKPVLLVKCSLGGDYIQSLLFQALADLAPLEFYPILEIPAGEPKLRDRLERALARYRLGTQARILERQADPRLLYQLSEAVLIDAYHPLGFSREIAEAGAFGKPALVPLVEGVRAQVQHDVNGWIFTTQGHHTLKASMARALTLPADKRRTMQAAAQLHVRSHFDVKNTHQEMLAAYEALLAADQPFPGVEDMVDFDGDPLELAAPDARSLGLIVQERERRPRVSLRESSPAVRHRLREMEDAPASAPAPTPTFAKSHPLETPGQAPRAPRPAMGSDIVPPPAGSSFSLLELAKKPGGPLVINPSAQRVQAADQIGGHAPQQSSDKGARQNAVDLSGPLGRMLNRQRQD